MYIDVVINNATTGIHRIFRPYFKTGLLINVIEHEQILQTDNSTAVSLCNSCNLRVSSVILHLTDPKQYIGVDFVSTGCTKESVDSMSVIDDSL